jgi:hypothetical protein
MQQSDLQLFRAKDNGRLSSQAIVSGARENLFARVTREQRENGASFVKKCFFKPAGADDGWLFGARLWIDAPTATDDWQWIAVAGQRETAPATPRRYTSCQLAAAVIAGATVITATLPVVSAADCFIAGDKVIISARPEAIGTGVEEVVEVASVSVSGATLTLALTSGLLSAYPATARLSSMLVAGDVAASLDNFSENSSGGTFDAALVELSARGAVEATFTITFNSASSFSVIADDADISLAAGSVASSYAPINSAFAAPYFTIPVEAWGGAWAAGDSVTFSVSPQAVGLWVGLEIPAGSQAGFANPAIVFDGDA